MCSYFFMLLVLQPTRVTDKSKTLIDNIFFNSFEFTTSSSNITHSISDPLIQLGSNKWKKDLHKIDWINEIFKNDNYINEIFDIFHKTLSEIVDRPAPSTKVTKKEKTLKSKPWINKEIKQLTWKREKLFWKYCACKKLKINSQRI